MGPAGRGEHRNKRVAGIAEQMRLQVSRRVKRLKIASRSKSRASPPTTTSQDTFVRPTQNHAESHGEGASGRFVICILHRQRSAKTRSIHGPRRTRQLQPRAFGPVRYTPPTSRFRTQAGQNRGGTQDFPAQITESGRSEHRESPTEKGQHAVNPYRAMRRKPRKKRMNDAVLPSFCGDLPRFPAIV
jgi:hypothetical protein